MGSADIALRKWPASEEMQHVVASSERAAHLTRQLLAYAGKGQFGSETFDLADLISRSRESLSASLPRGVSLKLNLPDEELLIRADPGQIEQVLMNLVINAGEAAAAQTEAPVEISACTCEVPTEAVAAHAPTYDAAPGKFVCLEVTDHGSGMDEATLAQIFNPFFSTKFTGRGLGLAAVQGIVRSCKGFVDVQSAPGGGSRFRVCLPSAARSAFPTSPASVTSGEPSRPDRAPATVLVVDDEDMVRELACAVLVDSGYEVLQAKDGAAALETLAGATSPPAVVLLDLSMPGMQADELVPILNEKYPNLRIILTTGYAEEDVRQRFASAAIAGFLQKPYSVPSLTRKVEETLGRTGSLRSVS